MFLFLSTGKVAVAVAVMVAAFVQLAATAAHTHTHPNEMRNDQKQTPFTTILLQCFGVVFRQHKSELHQNEWVPNECPRCAADIRNYLIENSLRSHTQINMVRCVCMKALQFFKKSKETWLWLFSSWQTACIHSFRRSPQNRPFRRHNVLWDLCIK